MVLRIGNKSSFRDKLEYEAPDIKREELIFEIASSSTKYNLIMPECGVFKI